MLYLAFTMGLFGSAHCLGMCGPLALGINQYSDRNVIHQIWHATRYNTGRMITYTVMGILFGIIGTALTVSGFQKIFSIVSGIFLITLFFLSLDIEKFLFRFGRYKNGYRRIQNHISNALQRTTVKYPLYMGILNGILPCGLVYLALAGSVATGNLLDGTMFMLLFGIGTFPAMFALMLGGQFMKMRVRKTYRKIFPVLHLLLGAYLIYRGFMVKIPLELEFWDALNNPLMCH